MDTHLRGLRGASFAVVAVLLAFTTLAGCSGGGDSGGAASGSDALHGSAGSAQRDYSGGSAGSDVQADGAQAEDLSQASIARGESPKTKVKNEALLTSRALIKTGSVNLRTKDVGQVLADITGIVTTHRGEIASESTTTNDKGKQERSQLQLRVPVNEFEAVLVELEGVGTLVERHSDEEDVTTQVVDVDARVQSARDAVESLNRLYVRATTLGQVITLEREISQRQADLESLLAQQKALADQTAMSTISLSVTRAPDKVAKPDPRDDRAGFVAGIKKGWDAFTAFVIGTGHAVGLALPLGSLFALLALLGWVVVRRRLPHREPQPTE